ncbi:sensor histidine kinase [Desulfobacter sp.]
MTGAPNMVLDTPFSRAFDIRPGRYVRISITDTGIGIDPEIQARIFEPFFTTKGMGRGTGLDLASAYGIIKNHDGAIDFVSRPVKGTIFYIYLPASGDNVETEPALSEIISQGGDAWALFRNRFPWSKPVPSYATYLTINDFFPGLH